MNRSSQRRGERRDWIGEVSAAMAEDGVSFGLYLPSITDSRCSVFTKVMESSTRRAFMLTNWFYPLLEEAAEQARANAEVLRIDIEDDTYERWTYSDLEVRAETARLIRSILIDGTMEEVAALRSGASRQLRRPGRGRQNIKPGPKPRTMEEVEQIVNLWRRHRNSGCSQKEFCELQGWNSRTILSDCLRRYRAKFGPNAI